MIFSHIQMYEGRQKVVSRRFSKIKLNEPQEPRQIQENIIVKGPRSTPKKKKEDVIVVKGDTPADSFKIDLTQVRAALAALKEIKHKMIKTLDPEESVRFKNMVDIIYLMYNSKAYHQIHDIVVEMFSDVQHVTPGTVGAYFAGCLVPTDFRGNPSCSAACASSVPPEHGTEGWHPCDKLALLYDGEGSFTTLNDPDDKKEAYVYVSASRNFNGFTADDIQKLTGYGVEKARIVRYSEDGRSYNEISNDFVGLASLAENRDVQVGDTCTNCSNGAAVALFVIVLVLLILALLILGWKFSGY